MHFFLWREHKVTRWNASGRLTENSTGIGGGGGRKDDEGGRGGFHRTEKEMKREEVIEQIHGSILIKKIFKKGFLRGLYFVTEWLKIQRLLYISLVSLLQLDTAVSFRSFLELLLLLHDVTVCLVLPVYELCLTCPLASPLLPFFCLHHHNIDPSSIQKRVQLHNRHNFNPISSQNPISLCSKNYLQIFSYSYKMLM